MPTIYAVSSPFGLILGGQPRCVVPWVSFGPPHVQGQTVLTLTDIGSGGGSFDTIRALVAADASVVLGVPVLSSEIVQLSFSPASTGASILTWGAHSLPYTTTTRYFAPGFDAGSASTTAIPFVVPRACTVRNLYVHVEKPNGNGSPVVYTVRRGIPGGLMLPTPLAVSLASTGSDASNVAASVLFNAGDRIDIEVTKALAIGMGIDDVVVSCELAT